MTRSNHSEDNPREHIAFFRVPAAFDALSRQVIARLLEEHTGTLRVWVPGCATGEEAYSLAILLQEQMAGLEAPPRVQIFATDVDEHALEIARQGIYPEDIAGDISAERLARFFVERGNRYRVTSELRGICLFSRHDLMSDPPFSHLDLVSCRNVLIPLEPSVQQKVMPMFHFALRPGGYLFQGLAESTHAHEELFLTIDAAHHISQRRPQETRTAERPAGFGSHPEQRAQRAQRAQIAQLERELARTRAQLERTVQELEASNDELKSANEELQLMNEELHATNDELEISKKELQTTNAALTQANSGLESLLVSTHIATVSLDDQMRIQSFSPAAAELYDLLPGDVGRPLAHITHRAVHMPPLPRPDEVERAATLIEHQVQMAGGRWYMRRVLPYRPTAGAQAGMVVTFVDITAFKRTEIALRESEQRSRVALHNTPMNVYQCDRELRYVWQANAHPDWSPERIIGHRPDDILPPAQATPLMTTMRRVLDTGAGTRHELSLDTSRGRQTWDMAIESLRDDDGAITGLTLAVLEVTQRKQTEEALRDQETRLRLALDAGRMGAWEWNIQTNDLVWSMAIYDQLGVPTTVDKPTAETFFDCVHPADLPRLLEALTRAQQGTDEYEVEFRVERPDGVIRWFQGKGAVFWDDTGTPLRMHGVIFDITDRKEAEERLQRIFEQAVVGIALVTEDGRWLQANRRLCEILGYAWDELRQRTLRDLAHADDAAELHERFREMLTGQRETFSMEARHLRRGGAIGWAHVSASFLVPAATERIFVAVVEDITASKHYEQAIEEEARHKDQFLAMLGHELRNPLAAIRNAVELQRVLDVEHSSLARARDVIERQSTHMARLIDDLLDVSRIARGKIQLEKVTLDLADLVATVAADHRSGIAKVGLTLSIEAPETPIWVMGDPTRLAQVVGNLLDNAAKFTQPPGAITVRAAQQGDTAVIEVRDTGVGIEPAMLERIFEVFQQASSVQSHSPGGLGLGLSLVQGLLALHQGTVEAHSAGPGTGASFLVRLPAGAPPAAHAPGQPGASAPGEAQRILVVDDNRDSADVLRDVLALAGHQVAVAYDGAEALALADQHRPDTVICDIGLPGGMTGYDVARALRGHALLASVRLIAMTGYGRNEDRVRAHEAGFDHHLTKPVTMEQIRQVLEP